MLRKNIAIFVFNDGFMNFGESIKCDPACMLRPPNQQKGQQDGGGNLSAMHPFYAVGLKYL